MHMAESEEFGVSRDCNCEGEMVKRSLLIPQNLDITINYLISNIKQTFI